MNTSNEEKDKLIKDTLQKDNIIANGTKDLKEDIKDDIDISKIKLKKYTFRQRKFTKFLAIVLVISLGFNVYQVKIGNENDSDNEQLLATTTSDNNIEPQNFKDAEEENETQEISSIVPISPKDKIEDVIIEDKTTEKENHALELDEELLKEEIGIYAISIGRFENNIDSLEENTILVLMASESFDNKKGPTGMNSTSSKYALTKDNVHLFIEEMTGIKNEQALSTYTNYIGYSEFSKAYVWGKDANILSNEKYEVQEVKLDRKSGSDYNVSGVLKKTIENEEYLYDFKATIALNKGYTYMPYTIKSFSAEIKNGANDNIVRLIDLVEETDEKKK